MQAAARAGQLKGLVKSKKMGSAQQQLLLLCFLFFLLSAVAPQVRASSFFFLPRLFPSRIHLHLQYASTAQHQQRNNQTLKNILSETPCFVSDTDLLRMLNIIDRALKYQTVLVRRPVLAATSKTESFIYFCDFMNLWACR